MHEYNISVKLTAEILEFRLEIYAFLPLQEY